jgi:PIN domain
MNLAGAKDTQIHSSEILRVEALCALSRKERAGQIKHGAAGPYQELRQDIAAGWIGLIPFGPGIVAEAERVLLMTRRAKAPRVLRSLDLIHLASALEGKANWFVATDVRLREMAVLAGLKVLP